jgi:hypothetical protein
MTTTTETGIWQKIKRVWAELDYAQQRLFEIRTGIPVTGRTRSLSSVEELEALYALERHAARP